MSERPPSDADGKFTLPVDLQSAAPHLLQGQHQGVNYNRMLPPGTAAGALSLDVFDVSNKVKEPSSRRTCSSSSRRARRWLSAKRIVFTNSGNVTFQDPAGTVKFYVPAAVTGPVRVRIQAPQGMPITRAG